MNGKMHGEGEIFLDNYRKFNGIYINDKKQGEGIFSFGDGTTIIWTWDHGKQHGI